MVSLKIEAASYERSKRIGFAGCSTVLDMTSTPFPDYNLGGIKFKRSCLRLNLMPGEIWSSPFEVGIVVATGQALQPQHQPMPSADAQRNRVKLIEVAAEAFAERGADASLEEIARQAGVGIGT